MLNRKVATPSVLRGRPCAVTKRRARGIAIYGPYERRLGGSYRVDFDLALADRAGRIASGQDCAIVEVVEPARDAILASERIPLAGIGGEARTFPLTFSIREPTVLEYRVHTLGVAGLAIGSHPRVTRIGGGPPMAYLDRLGIGAVNPADLQRAVREVMRLLRPVRAADRRKIRVGRDGDGGYVQLDDFEGLDTAFSFGINDEVSWDVDVANRGLTVYQFDHTVEAPLPDDPRFVFARHMIAPDRGPGQDTLADLIEAHDRRGQRPNMILKMDIECGEWGAIHATEAAALGRFSQIVCELHAFQNLWDEGWRKGVASALAKLGEHYAVVHVHGNVCGGISCVGGVVVPNVIEVTFANRALYRFEETDEEFPTPLDISCDPNEADFYLGQFRF